MTQIAKTNSPVMTVYATDANMCIAAKDNVTTGGLTMAISNRRALECAKTVVDYCEEQVGCQNCIFRIYGADRWKCNIEVFDLRDVLMNIEAKKKNHGYL